MKTGLLWFDDDPRKQLEEKVQRAATHYERKYGHAPDLCYVHPNVLGDDEGNLTEDPLRPPSEVAKKSSVQARCPRTHSAWLAPGAGWWHSLSGGMSATILRTQRRDRSMAALPVSNACEVAAVIRFSLLQVASAS